MFDYSFLRGRIVEKFGTCLNFAKKLGISKQELSRKLNNDASFTQKQIIEISKILELSETEVCRCFFVKRKSE